jgi:hypothetical protein
MREDVSRVKLFSYTFLGLYLPVTLIQMLGAAVYLGATANDSWMAAYTDYNVGGLVGQVLLDRGLGNFGRFLMVVFAVRRARARCSWSLPTDKRAHSSR